MNPRSGGGKAEQVGLVERARARGIDTIVLEFGQDLEQLANEAADRGADALGMAGGDGSLGVVAGVALTRNLPFFVVPVGTRNHFALDVGLDRDDPLASLDVLTDGDEIRVDYGLVEDRVFLNNLSLGLYAQAVGQERYREQKAETLLQELKGYLADPETRPDLTFETPDGLRHETAAMILISNNSYAWSGPPDFGRRSRLDGGRLGVVAAAEHPGGNSRVTRLGLGLGAYEFESPSFEVDARGESIEAGLDGEHVELAVPVTARVVRRGLRVLVPRGAAPGWQAPADRLAAGILSVSALASDRDE